MKTLLDLHNHINSLNNSIDDYLIINGYDYEALWKIIFLTKSNSMFYSKNIVYCDGNIKYKKLREINSSIYYLKNTKINIGCKSGVSDIVLLDKNDNKYILFSVKYFNEEKDLDNYDLLQIHSNMKSFYPNNKFELGLIVKSKKQFMIKYEKSRNMAVKVNLNEDYIFDLEDLKNYYKNLNHIETNKRYLKLHFHQKYIVNKTFNEIKKGEKSFLWGCKPRSGKSYMIGGLIDVFNKYKSSCKVLIITPAPRETKSQFLDDLFLEYQNFNHFDIIDLHSKSIKDIKHTSNPIIFITSKQYLQSKENLLPFDIDLLIFDEQHFGGTTIKSQDIIKIYSKPNTILISMTATYYKPSVVYKHKNNYYWSLEDETICKTIHNNKKLNTCFEPYLIDLLYNRLGLIEDEVEGMDLQEDFKIYNKMPQLHILTNMFHTSLFEKIKSKIQMNESFYGFSMDTLFAMKKDKFIYKDEIILILDYITGNNKECIEEFKDGNRSIFQRIQNINIQTNSRECNDMLWFLPISINRNIDIFSKELKKLMLLNKILKRYEILIINSKNNEISDDMDLKQYIINERKLAIENGKKGVIILAGLQLSLGVSLPFIDCVFLLNNFVSMDKIYQMMFRCMTEDKGKRNGFVIDFQLNRVLQTCLNYNSNNLKLNDNLNTEKHLKYIIENHLISIDEDMFKLKKLEEKHIVDKLLEIWKLNPENELDRCLKMIEQEVIELDKHSQSILNKYFDPNDKSNITKATLIMNDEEEQEIQDGIERNLNPDYSPKSSNSCNEDVQNKDINIQITKDVLYFIVPLLTILSYNKDIELNLRVMLEMISQNPNLMECFNSQCYIWWNKNNLYDIIYKIVSKYVENNSTIYNACLNIKLNIQSLIDKPNDLLEFIQKCLKPKEKEKKQFGEVFTPMELVNEMLDKLPIEVWSNPNLKWFDPANGMGNYPIAIYYRLMNGLKEVILDVNSRKKHILENMLYMSELNIKNCYICNLIFNSNGKYKLNLHCGDSLKLDIKKEWGIDKFDIIIGNPPYNTEFNGAGASPLYNKFIEYYVNKCNLLIFIVPSRWFAGGKGLDSFRKMMLSRKDIVFINHYNDASIIFGNNVDIKGGVNYFLINNNYNGLCSYNNNLIDLSECDILIDNIFYNIIETLNRYDKITNIYCGSSYFEIQTNDKRLCDEHRENHLKCYVSQQKGFSKYIDNKYIKKEHNIYRIITTEASFKSNSGFGNMFISSPYEVYSQSYISFRVNNEDEAKSLLSYLKCRLPNFMLSLRKISQHINITTCKWIPLPPLDRIWNDYLVYQYFNLNKEDIELIKSTKIIGFN
jgi:site-specific DNA-methyltransferase (adenine-specific)